MTKTRRDNKGRILKTGESQRENGGYDYRWTGKDGKRHSKYAPSLKELREIEKAVQRDLEDGINTFASHKITVAEAYERYLKLLNVRRSTRERYESYLTKYKQFDFANYPLDAINQSKCIRFVMDMNKDLSAVSTKRYIAQLKIALNLAVADGLIRTNPFDFDYSKYVKDNVNPPRVGLTDEEFDSFIEFMKEENPWLIPHTIVLRETGLRVTEFLGLTVNDIDFDRHELSVERRVEKRDRVYHVEPLKTDGSKAKIPMTPQAEEALRTLINRCHETISLDGADGFFVQLQNKRNFIHRKNFGEYYRKLTRAYNEQHPDHPIRVTPHILRHSTPAHFFRMGMSVQFVQGLMRHTKIDITMQVYTHLTASDLVEELYGKLA